MGLRTYTVGTDSMDIRAGRRLYVDDRLEALVKSGEKEDLLVALPGQSYFLSRGLSDLKLSIAVNAQDSLELAQRIDDVVREAFTVTAVTDREAVSPLDGIYSTAYGMVQRLAPPTTSHKRLMPFLVTVLRALADTHPRGSSYGYVSQYSSREALMELVTEDGRDSIRSQVRGQRELLATAAWDEKYQRQLIHSRLAFILGQMLGDPGAWDVPDGIFIPEMISRFHAFKVVPSSILARRPGFRLTENSVILSTTMCSGSVG
ncbi:hypothetical protein [Rathayibacter tritici]|uniref:hypothetical protein n=1 Tax=Rathayibacter tritici TaxID=33888 RepID=UPI0011B04E59|nr:hypothetical protein [Rathayibacter tritici]